MLLIIAALGLLLAMGLAWLRADDALMQSSLRALRTLRNVAILFLIASFYMRRRLSASRHAEPGNARRRRNALDCIFGIGRKIDNARALSLLQRAYQDGDRLAGAVLAGLLRRDPSNRNSRQDLRIMDDCSIALSRLARSGNKEAGFILCWLMTLLPPSGRTRRLLLRYLPACCEAGLIEAWYLSGFCHARGAFLQEDADIQQAADWFEKAAQSDCALAISGLGILLSDPDLPWSHPQRGADLLKQAAERGDDLSKLRLAYITLKGVGVTPDPASALVWLELVSGPLRSVALLKSASIRMSREYGLLDYSEARRLLEEVQPLLNMLAPHSDGGELHTRMGEVLADMQTGDSDDSYFDSVLDQLKCATESDWQRIVRVCQDEIN
ncbi:MAG: hypothetical protein R3F46_04910 [bacterium]